MGAVVAGHLHFAIIRAHPDDAGPRGGFGDRDDRAVLNGGVLGIDLLRIIRSEVRADHFPVIAAVFRAQNKLRSVVERIVVVRRYPHRRDPIEPVENRIGRGNGPAGTQQTDIGERVRRVRLGRIDDRARTGFRVVAAERAEFLRVVYPTPVGSGSLYMPSPIPTDTQSSMFTRPDHPLEGPVQLSWSCRPPYI